MVAACEKITQTTLLASSVEKLGRQIEGGGGGVVDTNIYIIELAWEPAGELGGANTMIEGGDRPGDIVRGGGDDRINGGGGGGGGESMVSGGCGGGGKIGGSGGSGARALARSRVLSEVRWTLPDAGVEKYGRA